MKQQRRMWSTHKRVKLLRRCMYGHALVRGGSVATRRAVIGGGDAGEGKGEVRH